MTNVVSAIFVGLFVKAALDQLGDLIRKAINQPDYPLPWLALVALVLGGGLSYLLGINVFPIVGNALVGRIMTAVAVGFGVDFLNGMLAAVQNRVDVAPPNTPFTRAVTPVRWIRGW
jgi:hypothetical protein